MRCPLFNTGTKPCKNCQNLFGKRHAGHLGGGNVGIECIDRTAIVYNTDAMVYAAYDAIAAAPDADRKELQQLLGIKFNQFGIMSDPWLRSIYLPVTHNIRDWMHMLVSGGCANTLCAIVLNALGRHRISLDMVGTFIETFTLPSRHGKPSAKWVGRKRLGKKRDSLASFSGIMLSLIPILNCFLAEVITADHPMADHAKCFDLLTRIVGILGLGPSVVLDHLDVLGSLIDEWGAVYVALCRPADIKPKFHNFYVHMIGDINKVGKLLSCFVTERKHRTTKRAALFTFRAIDNAVGKNLLHRQCESFITNGDCLFSRKYLINAREVAFSDGTVAMYSTQSILPCGLLKSKDIVWLASGDLGKIVRFWSSSPETSAVQLETYTPVNADKTRWDISSPVLVCADTDDIVDAVAWGVISDTCIRILKPCLALV